MNTATVLQILGLVAIGSVIHRWISTTADGIDRAVVVLLAVCLLTMCGIAQAVPVSDLCSEKPAAVQSSGPFAGPKSPILKWITVRSSGPRIPGLRCTDPVLDIPEPELIAFDIEVPFPALMIEEIARLWAQPRFGWWSWAGYGDPKKRRDEDPPLPVSEPPSWVMWAAGLVLLGWLGYERTRRRKYLDREERRKSRLFDHPAVRPNGRPALWVENTTQASWDPAGEAGRKPDDVQ